MKVSLRFIGLSTLLLAGTPYAINAQTGIDGDATSNGFVLSGPVTISTITSSSATFTTATISSGTVKSFTVLGTTTNDSAPTGRVGEFVSSAVSAVSAGTSAQWNDLTSISLTAGDWDVSGVMLSVLDSGSWSAMQAGISTSSGSSGTGLNAGDNEVEAYWASTSSAIQEVSLTIPTYRMSLSSTTTVYLKRMNIYSSGGNRTWGRISARRMR